MVVIVMCVVVKVWISAFVVAVCEGVVDAKSARGVDRMTNRRSVAVSRA